MPRNSRGTAPILAIDRAAKPRMLCRSPRKSFFAQRGGHFRRLVNPKMRTATCPLLRREAPFVVRPGSLPRCSASAVRFGRLPKPGKQKRAVRDERSSRCKGHSVPTDDAKGNSLPIAGCQISSQPNHDRASDGPLPARNVAEERIRRPADPPERSQSGPRLCSLLPKLFRGARIAGRRVRSRGSRIAE